MRRNFELANGWFIAKDEDNRGVAECWEKSVKLDATPAFVPSIIQQFFPDYNGLAYYWCRFVPNIEEYPEGRILLCFGGVDYKADVWLNGVHLGTEMSPETPFTFDITDTLLRGEENLLAIRVLNPGKETIDGLNLMNVPHRNKKNEKRAGSTINYGGIPFGVTISALPSAYINDAFVIADFNTGKITLKIDLAGSYSGKAELNINVAEKCGGVAVAEIKDTIDVELPHTYKEFSLSVPDFKPWHVDSPNLYTMRITVATNSGEHIFSTNFGFREFSVKDGFFYLNGKKIYLKSAHTGNVFPIGLTYPVDLGQLRRDLIYAKSSGFNMIRSITGCLRPEQLDLADEIGIMIYEECVGAWCLGYSMHQKWANDEEFKNLDNIYPDMPLGDEQEMLARWRSVVEKMILRDRNHASIVTWGLLNETLDNGVYRAARDFLPRLRELDPSRFVILSSGRQDLNYEIGSSSNPYTNEWEITWGIDGHPEFFENYIKNGGEWIKITPDNHFYAHFPLKEVDKELFLSYGKDYLPVFLSEMGQGALFNVIDELRHFKQFGARGDLGEITWLESQISSFEADFKRLSMDRSFAFPEHALRESQRNNAFVRRELFDVLRANPNIPGYSLTGLLDHGWCGEGLFSYWREWKPEMFDAVNEGWAPLRFSLFASHNIYDDEPVRVEAHIANDGVLKGGTYTAHFAITKNCAPVYTFNKEFTLKDGDLAAPIMKCTLDLKLPAGEYELCAELDEAAPRANKLPFTVKARGANRADGCKVACLGIPESVVKLLENAGVIVEAFDIGKTPEVLLVGDADENEIASVIDLAERGSKVLFLSISSYGTEPALAQLKRVVPDISVFRANDWLYHKEMVLCDKDVFDGVGYGLAQGRDFVKEWPRLALMTETTPDYPICPAFETGSYRALSAYYLVHVIAGYRFGCGEVYLNTLELINNVGSPTADNLLINLVKRISAN